MAARKVNPGRFVRSAMPSLPVDAGTGGPLIFNELELTGPLDAR